MKEIKLNLHSIVDVITNSSTMVYIMATTKSIDLAKKFINKILTFSGSDKTADDLFDFSIEINDEKYLYTDYLADCKSDELDEKEILSLEDWRVKTIEEAADDYDNYTTSSVVIKPKDTTNKKMMDLVSEFEAIFNIEARADY